MSEQIVQVADASPSTKNMRTIQQTAGGNTVQSEVVILATGAANGGDTYDARQIRTLTSADIVTSILQGVTLGQKPMTGSLPVVIASNQSAVSVSGTVTANQGTAGGVGNAWPTKISDGTNTAALTSLGTPPTSSQVGLITESLLFGPDVLSSTPAAITTSVSGFGRGIDIAGGYADNTSIAIPDSTVDKIVTLVAIANATSPPSISENGVGFLSIDFNRNLRTIVQNTPTVKVSGINLDGQGQLLVSEKANAGWLGKGTWGPGWGNFTGW
jgi:hypothetical protein